MEQTIHRAPQAADRSLAVRRLDEALSKGTNAARNVVAGVLNHQPHDAIVRARALGFTFDNGALLATAGDSAWSFHSHAFGQLASTVAPKGSEYLNMLRDGDTWQHDMLADILTRTFQHAPEAKRHLVRSVGGLGNEAGAMTIREARGFLSDKYRRIDSRPLCEAFVDGCLSYGAQPYGGSAMDCRWNLKFIRPEIEEPVPGEFVCFGLEESSGDFGGVSHQLREFCVRLWCLNGATVEDLLRQIHLGSRLADHIEFSDKTMQLDTDATLSAVKDLVKASFDPAARAARVARIAAAASERTDARGAFSSVARNLTKAELEAATEAFSGPDVVNLPEAPTRWRASNVLSFLAQRPDQPAERREDLERLAGALLNVKAAA